VLSPRVAITAYSPQIPDSIFTSFSILDGLSGTGFLSYSYSNTFLGGGRGSFNLIPTVMGIDRRAPSLASRLT
jgi:hypothetical protein